MSIQDHFRRFHKKIKVEKEELREKRDILLDKIRASLKKAGHPLPELLNQGSYIYGVGVKPVDDEEHDIDVGLDFPILSSEYDAKEVRKWVYDAVKDHTDNVENRGPCIRVRYAAGFHVDLVVYARYKNDESQENYQLAKKDNVWRPAEPKKLKEYISNARKPFSDSKDSSGSDQLQRVTRYLKRWNDLDIPGDSPDKPFGLATLLLVIHHLSAPISDLNGDSDDLGALVQVCQGVDLTFGRISIKKPTQEYEDLFAKLSDKAMERLKQRFSSLLKDLRKARTLDDDEAAKLLRKQFGDDFPESLRKSEMSLMDHDRNSAILEMKAAVPTFSNPSRPWCAK